MSNTKRRESDTSDDGDDDAAPVELSSSSSILPTVAIKKKGRGGAKKFETGQKHRRNKTRVSSRIVGLNFVHSVTFSKRVNWPQCDKRLFEVLFFF